MDYLLRVLLVYTCASIAICTSSLSIKISPLYTVVAQDTSVHLHCIVTSTLMSTTRWFNAESNVEISNHSDRFNVFDNGTLEITGFSTHDDGLYYCIGSNSLGSVRSLQARIQIASIGSVQVTSETISFRANENLKLPCNTPDSVPPAEVTWYKGSLVVTANDRIGITLDNSLVFSYCLDDDNGPWNCKVKNSLLLSEAGSNSYLLKETNNPVTAIQTAKLVFVPVNKTVTSGSSLELQCIATGRPSPSYTWMKDGKTVEESDGISFAQNSRILKISKAKVTDSGDYRCRVDQTAISHMLLSDLASVVVKDPPSIISPSPDSISQKGSLSVSLWCMANGTLPITWSWYKNATLVEQSDNIDIQTIITNTGSQSHLTVQSLYPKDAGVWQCVASNDEAGADQSTQLLIVNTTYPVVSQQANDVLAFVGDNVTLPFFCKAYPFPTFSWLEDSEIISLQARHTINDDSPFSGTLTISPVTASDSGVFRATCSNVEGDVTSNAVIVKIIDIPDVLVSPESKLVSLGSGVMIHCNIKDVSGISLEYSWNRDFNQVLESDRITVQANGSLYITNFSADDIGYYDCTVTLKSASSAAEPLEYAVGGAFITEDPPTRPSKPINPSIGFITSKSVAAEWTEPLDSGGLQILGYTMEITNHGRHDCVFDNDNINITTINSSTRQMTVPLSPYTRYSIVLYAFNSLGHSMASERTENFWTLEDVPSASPFNVSARQGDNVGELLVSWEPPPCQQRNGLLVNYTVTAQSSIKQFSLTTSSNLTSVTLRQLIALQQYVVQVSATTAAGSGPLSLLISTETTLASVPDVPRSMTASQVNLTSALITWDPPSPRSNEPVNELTRVMQYLLRYENSTLNLTATNHTVVDLRSGPRSVVEFKVAAINSFGAGESASLIVWLPDEPSNDETPSNTTTERIEFYQEEWFPVFAGGVGGALALVALLVCIIICAVSYRCKRKGNKHISSFNSSGSNHSFAYPNRKSTVLDKMMQVESMESPVPGDRETEVGTTGIPQDEGTDGQDSSSTCTMTTSQSSSTLRSKYQYRSPMEQEEYQQLGDLRQSTNSGIIRGRAKTNGSRHSTNPSNAPNTPPNSCFHGVRELVRETSPTDTVSSFEYQSQTQMMSPWTNKQRPLYTTDGYDTSSEDESIIHRVNPLKLKQLDDSLVGRNGHVHKYNPRKPPNLALMTALPQDSIPPYMPTALPVNKPLPDLLRGSNRIQQLNRFPRSRSNSSQKNYQINGIEQERQATFV